VIQKVHCGNCCFLSNELIINTAFNSAYLQQQEESGKLQTGLEKGEFTATLTGTSTHSARWLAAHDQE